MADPIEEIIKSRLERRRATLLTLTGECPPEKALWDYLNDSVRQEAEEKIADHVVKCDFCLESLLLAQEVRLGIRFGFSEGPGGEAHQKAIDLARKRKIQKSGIKRHLWLILSLLAIGASFLFARYFFQFLILGVIFGVKWVFDTTTNRTLIIMSEVLKKKGAGKEPSREMRERTEEDK